MSSRDGVPSLALDDLRQIASDLKEDLQRKANQGIRKKDLKQGIGSLASMEAIEELLRLCELRAQMYAEAERRLERRKPGSKVTALPAPGPPFASVKKLALLPTEMPGWARERVKG